MNVYPAECDTCHRTTLMDAGADPSCSVECCGGRLIPRCPFCEYVGPNDVLWRHGGCYVVEPIRQITPGHVLVIPERHAEDFADDPDVTAAVFRAAALFAQAEELGDCNLITSRGPAASQTVPHVHVHLLPRRWSDSVRLPWRNPNVPPKLGIH